MTTQEIFDKVITHLREQKSKAVNHENKCMYRAPNNKKCAFGVLIPDEIYSIDMEGKKSYTVIENNKPLNDIYGKNIDIIQNLQNIHDTCSVDAWERNFELTARIHRVNYTPQS